MNKPIEEHMEELGQIVDRIDNLLAAAKMPIPPQMKLECTLTSLRKISEELKIIVIDVTGENPWED
jgi:septation ring formation regulator EzrA